VQRADVLVVGGGPAGSSLAFGLREAGLDVVVLDRRVFPRDKTCAGWVTPAVFSVLGIDPEVYGKTRVLQPVRGFAVRRIGDREARPRFAEPISYGIRRCEFDSHLLERAEAQLRLGEPLRRLERRHGTWIANGSVAAPLVVGAGGHFCPVARQLAPGRDPEPIVAAKEIEIELDAAQAAACPVEEDLPELFFTEDLRGYGWVFRKGAWLNVGLGRQDTRGLPEHLARFLAWLVREGRLPTGLPDTFKGHAYLLYGEAERALVGEGFALVGDAAGLAYPRSGEGIRPAVESGLLLAQALRGAARPDDPSALTAYARSLEEHLGPRNPPARRGLTDWLPDAVTRRLAGLLFGTPGFARHVVIERWFVRASAPLSGL
jgi:geranylgeranyl reductase family protein